MQTQYYTVAFECKCIVHVYVPNLHTTIYTDQGCMDHNGTTDAHLDRLRELECTAQARILRLRDSKLRGPKEDGGGGLQP